MDEKTKKGIDKTVEIRYNNGRARRGVAQFGRVLGLGPRCRRFKSCRLDQSKKSVIVVKLHGYGLFLCFYNRFGKNAIKSAKNSVFRNYATRNANKKRGTNVPYSYNDRKFYIY